MGKYILHRAADRERRATRDGRAPRGGSKSLGDRQNPESDEEKKILSPRSRPTARLNPALFLDHNHHHKGTEPERTSQEATEVIGNMTNSEATKEERATEMAPPTDEGKFTLFHSIPFNFIPF